MCEYYVICMNLLQLGWLIEVYYEKSTDFYCYNHLIFFLLILQAEKQVLFLK